MDKNRQQQIILLCHRRYIHIGFLILIAVISACSCNPIDTLRLRFKAYKFPAKSMIPTLLPGERILVDRLHYQDHNPQRGDIIVFEYSKDPKSDFLKRVIAIEKDVIKGEKGKVYVNGQVLEEHYVQHTRYGAIEVMNDFGPISVPKGKLFVMGDNRDESFDSRHFGVVSLEKVKGRVVYIYWSKEWSRIGTKVI